MELLMKRSFNFFFRLETGWKYIQSIDKVFRGDLYRINNPTELDLYYPNNFDLIPVDDPDLTDAESDDAQSQISYTFSDHVAHDYRDISFVTNPTQLSQNPTQLSQERDTPNTSIDIQPPAPVHTRQDEFEHDKTSWKTFSHGEFSNCKFLKIPLF